LQHLRDVFEVDEGTGTNKFIAAAANLDEDMASSSPGRAQVMKKIMQLHTAS